MKNLTLGIVATILGVLTVLGIIWVLAVMPETPKIPKCPDLSCPEPIVTTETVEVIKEVEVTPDYKQQVVDALLDEVSKDKSLRYCDDDKYSSSEITLKKVYNGFTLTEDSDGDTSISDVQIKLNYDEGKCYRTFVCGLDTENELVC